MQIQILTKPEEIIKGSFQCLLQLPIKGKGAHRWPLCFRKVIKQSNANPIKALSTQANAIRKIWNMINIYYQIHQKTQYLLSNPISLHNIIAEFNQLPTAFFSFSRFFRFGFCRRVINPPMPCVQPGLVIILAVVINIL